MTAERASTTTATQSQGHPRGEQVCYLVERFATLIRTYELVRKAAVRSCFRDALVRWMLLKVSTAFAALLGPHFREGQQLGTSQSPVTIPLPEDDPDAMLDLFRLLHLVAVPSLLAADDSKRMQSFAVAADKWCCIEALQLQAQGMLLAAVGQLGTDVTPLGLHMARLATTAYLFNHQQCFAVLVKRMVLGTAGSYLDVWRQIDEQTLPAQFYLLLANKHKEIRAYIAERLSSLATKCQECFGAIQNEGIIERTEHILQQLKEPFNPSWVDGRACLEAGLLDVQSLQPMEITRAQNYCVHCGRRALIPRERFAEIVRTAESSSADLAVRCVRQGCLEFEDHSFRCVKVEHREVADAAAA